MKNILAILVVVLFLTGCRSSKNTAIDVGNFSSASTIGAHMNFLASDDLKGREAGTDGIEQGASYIAATLESFGLKPYYSSFQDTLVNFEPAAYNLVGMLRGNDPSLRDELVLIGAHYDHIGIVRAKEGDSIANGANDNASGTSTVLELARYFGKAKTNKRTLVFALFSAEEKGLKGSEHLARKMKEEGVDLYAVLNFEMTGVAMRDKDYLVYVTGYNKSNIASVANTHAGENVVGFLPTAEGYNLFKRSDNYPFFEEFNIPSHTFCTFDFTNFDHYHQVGDEAELMDFGHMATVVNKMIPAVEGIANSKEREIKLN
ncbi:M28 family metallopeptidase [Muriicola marianensis]|uniref:Peptidase M28 n=1 Tax=Muriicola marianensis TaxID=1324801 RepID=A0ABQ1R3X7_9FLAO|nr:M20/M25/M40 family metallo-hydrolase [Muriicola marianensis]GGD54863.1 peptidase M28 [Muriicola marianensis]